MVSKLFFVTYDTLCYENHVLFTPLTERRIFPNSG